MCIYIYTFVYVYIISMIYAYVYRHVYLCVYLHELLRTHQPEITRFSESYTMLHHRFQWQPVIWQLPKRFFTSKETTQGCPWHLRTSGIHEVWPQFLPQKIHQKSPERYRRRVSSFQVKMDWFCWENLNRKPWFLHHQIAWVFRFKF